MTTPTPNPQPTPEKRGPFRRSRALSWLFDRIRNIRGQR